MSSLEWPTGIGLWRLRSQLVSVAAFVWVSIVASLPALACEPRGAKAFDCGVFFGCVVGSSTLHEGKLSADVSAGVEFSGADPRCPFGAVTTEFEAALICEDEVAGGARFSELLEAGVATRGVSFGASVEPGAACRVEARAILELEDGARAAIDCSSGCFDPVISPGIDIRRDSAAPVVVSRESTALVTYRIENSSNEAFDGSIRLQIAHFPTATAPFVRFNEANSTSCRQPEPPPSWRDCSDAVEAPVCGCDGKIYANLCVLENSGVQLYSPDAGAPHCDPTPPVELISGVAPFTSQGAPFLARFLPTDAEPARRCLAVVYGLEGPEEIDVSVPAGASVPVVIEVALREGFPTPQQLAQLELRVVGEPGACISAPLIEVHERTLFAQDCEDVEPVRVCANHDPCCGQGGCRVVERGCFTQTDRDCDFIPDVIDGVSGADADGDGLGDRLEHRYGAFDRGLADRDSDGLTDLEEVSSGTSLVRADTDDDGLGDAEDDYPRQPDVDGDGLFDGIDPYPFEADRDADAAFDAIDPDPDNPDSDGDGFIDGLELALGFDPVDPSSPGVGFGLVDSDSDGLVDEGDVDPLDPDVDGDGLTDGQERLLYGSDPELLDTDSDGLSDRAEVMEHFTDPTNTDTDQDSIGDGVELGFMLAPLEPDTDFDGASDADELFVYGSDPRVMDTDGGGAFDGIEIERGFDPTHAGDDPFALERATTGAILTLATPDEERIALALMNVSIKNMRVGVEASSTVLDARVGVMRANMHVLDPVAVGGLEGVLEFELKMYALDDLSEPLAGYVFPEDRSNLSRCEAPLLRSSATLNDVLYDVRHEVFLRGRSGDGAWEELVLDEYWNVIDQGEQARFDFMSSTALDTFELTITARAVRRQRSRPSEDCYNGEDDDGDGAVDIEDSDCEPVNPCAAMSCPSLEVCDDGIDNDGNGLIDCEERACHHDPYCDAYVGGAPFEDCRNGVDDNADGQIDCDDYLCQDTLACEEQCTDDVDNNGDGDIDCADWRCSEHVLCRVPGQGRGCGGCVSSTPPSAPLEWPLGLLGLFLFVRRRFRFLAWIR